MTIEKVENTHEIQQCETLDVLCRAFSDDPYACFVYPKNRRRQDAMERLLRPSVQFGSKHGTVVVERIEGKIAGVAIWVDWHVVESKSVLLIWMGLCEFLRHFDIGAGIRCLIYFLHAEAVHQRVMKAIGGHQYLFALGVEPVCWRQGIGRHLISTDDYPVIDVAGKGLACYLETVKPENVQFYEACGFMCVEESQVPFGGPKMWSLVRR